MIRREFTKRELWVEVDTDKMIQVIDNIMNNAIKYSPDGGVITVKLMETHNNIVLSINDQGLGIPKKDLTKIFDRFYRVDKARARQQGGTGLGLAISREVIKSHGEPFGQKAEKTAVQHFISCCHMNRMRRIGGNESLRKMIRLGLIVMVALSFYFSYMIWLNPTGYDRSVEQATDTVNTSIQTYKQKVIYFCHCI